MSRCRVNEGTRVSLISNYIQSVWLTGSAGEVRTAL